MLIYFLVTNTLWVKQRKAAIPGHVIVRLISAREIEECVVPGEAARLRRVLKALHWTVDSQDDRPQR
jgi:hypothetical protein